MTLSSTPTAYAALKALYNRTSGDNWRNNTGWTDWDFNSQTLPSADVVNGWYGVVRFVPA
ncbi:MAG: hypothetical protein GDA48_01975 [Hormoscilla sp. GM102CHS1]|nr:hypothetical protein [Hormoscilla sp. GM102CHS1]